MATRTVGIRYSKSSIITHREAISTADGSVPPGITNSTFAANPNNMIESCRVYTSVVFAGASDSMVFRPYLRTGGTTGVLGMAEAVTVSSVGAGGTAKTAFDIQANGDDVLVFIERINGAGTATVYLSWR